MSHKVGGDIVFPKRKEVREDVQWLLKALQEGGGESASVVAVAIVTSGVGDFADDATDLAERAKNIALNGVLDTKKAAIQAKLKQLIEEPDQVLVCQAPKHLGHACKHGGTISEERLKCSPTTMLCIECGKEYAAKSRKKNIGSRGWRR